MKKGLKITLLALMTLAMLFGFIHGRAGQGAVNYERLHVFLFNLCAGGFLLLYHAEGRVVTWRCALFMVLALGFAAAASLGVFPAAIATALALGIIVEKVRWRRFAWFPSDLFRGSGTVDARFLHAALLCLSLALFFSAGMMAVKTYFALPLPSKLDIDIFFLGFSFPVSLVTMSVIFSSVESPASRTAAALQGLSFWAVNAGVMLFFVFIVAGWRIAQAVISVVLFASVILIFIQFNRGTRGLQRKSILVSGMAFLVVSALTGIGYIAAREMEMPAGLSGFVMTVHGYVSLYGWNQTGLLVIMRYDDFPLRLNPALFIALHWTAVVLLAPVGEQYLQAGLAATFLYTATVAMALFAGRGCQAGPPG